MSDVLWLRCVACCWPVGSWIGCKLEELCVGAVSHGVEWLRRALSQISRDELRRLAAVGGVETRSSKNWLPVAELRDGLMKVLVPSREVGCVKNLVLTKFVSLIAVQCSSHGAIL